MEEKIIEYRARHNMSQVEFAKLVGVDRATIIRAENGKGISKLTEAKIKMAIEKEASTNV